MVVSESPSLVLEFRLTQEEFISGQRLYLRTIAPMSQRACHMLKVPLGVLLIVLGAIGISLGQNPVIVIPVFALGICLILLRTWLYIRRLRNAYAKYPNLQGEQHWDFSEAHISSRGLYSDGNIGWQLVTKYAQSSTLVVVQLAPPMFFIIPKRAFADNGQLQTFHDLLSTKISARKNG